MRPPQWSSFRNPNDAACATAVWAVILVAFLAYLGLTTRAFVADFENPDRESTYNERIQTPIVTLDVCELQALVSELNYSLLDNLFIKREVEYSLVNGSEVYANEFADAAGAPRVELHGTFSCARIHSVAQVPQDAILPYHRWFIAMKKGFPSALQRAGNGYVSGLFVRPSLAENATHPVATREENIVKVWLPFLAQNRTSIVRTTPSLEKYSDSLGGRLGAPFEDTFFLDDTTVIPQAAQTDIPNVTELPDRGNFLKLVLPVPTTLVKVHHHVNDIVKDTMSWLSRIASATFLFGMLQVLFPQARQEKFHLFLHMPGLGLGTPAELDPLLSVPEPSPSA